MDEDFKLPVTYNGKELSFPSRLVQYGYTYKIEVIVNGATLFFERDEERNWRALMDPGKIDDNINVDLINAIMESIERYL